MLQNAYLLAKIGADTAEIEQHFAEILPIGCRGGRQPLLGVDTARVPGAGDAAAEVLQRDGGLVVPSWELRRLVER